MPSPSPWSTLKTLAREAPAPVAFAAERMMNARKSNTWPRPCDEDLNPFLRYAQAVFAAFVPDPIAIDDLGWLTEYVQAWGMLATKLEETEDRVPRPAWLTRRWTRNVENAVRALWDDRNARAHGYNEPLCLERTFATWVDLVRPLFLLPLVSIVEDKRRFRTTSRELTILWHRGRGGGQPHRMFIGSGDQLVPDSSVILVNWPIAVAKGMKKAEDIGCWPVDPLLFTSVGAMSPPDSNGSAARGSQLAFPRAFLLAPAGEEPHTHRLKASERTRLHADDGFLGRTRTCDVAAPDNQLTYAVVYGSPLYREPARRLVVDQRWPVDEGQQQRAQEAGFTLEEVKGGGAFGVVIRATRAGEPTKHKYALKFLHRPEGRERILDRVGRLKEASGSGGGSFVEYHIDIDLGPDIVVMEHVDGLQLDEWTRGATRHQRLQVADRIVRSVRALHDHDLSHRDLHPRNILVRTDNGDPEPVIIDFGLARDDQRVASTGTSTLGARPFGALPFAAPEQVAAQVAPGDWPRADVHALGWIVAMLLREPPAVPSNASLSLTEYLGRKQDAPPFLALWAAKNPAERPRDAEAAEREWALWRRADGKLEEGAGHPLVGGWTWAGPPARGDAPGWVSRGDGSIAVALTQGAGGATAAATAHDRTDAPSCVPPEKAVRERRGDRAAVVVVAPPRATVATFMNGAGRTLRVNPLLEASSVRPRARAVLDAAELLEWLAARPRTNWPGKADIYMGVESGRLYVPAFRQTTPLELQTTMAVLADWCVGGPTEEAVVGNDGAGDASLDVSAAEFQLVPPADDAWLAGDGWEELLQRARRLDAWKAGDAGWSSERCVYEPMTALARWIADVSTTLPARGEPPRLPAAWREVQDALSLGPPPRWQWRGDGPDVEATRREVLVKAWNDYQSARGVADAERLAARETALIEHEGAEAALREAQERRRAENAEVDEGHRTNEGEEDTFVRETFPHVHMDDLYAWLTHEGRGHLTTFGEWLAFRNVEWSRGLWSGRFTGSDDVPREVVTLRPSLVRWDVRSEGGDVSLLGRGCRAAGAPSVLQDPVEVFHGSINRLRGELRDALQEATHGVLDPRAPRGRAAAVVRLRSLTWWFVAATLATTDPKTIEGEWRRGTCTEGRTWRFTLPDWLRGQNLADLAATVSGAFPESGEPPSPERLYAWFIAIEAAFDAREEHLASPTVGGFWLRADGTWLHGPAHGHGLGYWLAGAPPDRPLIPQKHP